MNNGCLPPTKTKFRQIRDSLSQIEQTLSHALRLFRSLSHRLCLSCTCESVVISRPLLSRFECSNFAARKYRSVALTPALPGVPQLRPGENARQWQRCGAPPRLSTKCRPKLHSMPRRAWRTIWPKVEQAARARASFRGSGVGASSS